jgi:acyl-CoA reductase-like NAD-dependent aldehyde dehydrogenase
MTIAIRRPALGSAATAFLAKKHQMLIDGKWVDARSGETFAVEDPATEETIAYVPAGDKADESRARGNLRSGRPRSILRRFRSRRRRQIRQRHGNGLSSSVWTRNLKAAHMMARKIGAGTVCINTHNCGDPAWPFGGYRQSGWGREMGKEVMEHYTETKAVAARL